MMRLHLDPADNFLVRDGRPFNQDDAGRAAAASRFPPPPDTVYGAVRVALARALGWDGIGDWMRGTAAEPKQLGSFGPAAEAAAAMQVAGPWFDVAGTPLLPLPAAAFRDGVSVRLAQPGPAVATDMGPVRLLALPPRGRLAAGRWAPETAVRRLLAEGAVAFDDCRVPVPGWVPFIDDGRVPPGVDVQQLGAIEARVGLERDTASRTAVSGRLYASVRRQLPPGVSLIVDVAGVQVATSAFAVPIPFGGEGRFVFVEAAIAPPVPAQPNPGQHYCVSLITPAILPPLAVGAQVCGLPGTLISAVVPEVGATAGFVRSEDGRRQLTNTAAVLPPGTTLFLAGGAGQQLPSAIGERQWRGYGRFLTGVWRDGQ